MRYRGPVHPRHRRQAGAFPAGFPSRAAPAACVEPHSAGDGAPPRPGQASARPGSGGTAWREGAADEWIASRQCDLRTRMCTFVCAHSRKQACGRREGALTLTHPDNSAEPLSDMVPTHAPDKPASDCLTIGSGMVCEPLAGATSTREGCAPGAAHPPLCASAHPPGRHRGSLVQLCALARPPALRAPANCPPLFRCGGDPAFAGCTCCGRLHDASDTIHCIPPGGAGARRVRRVRRRRLSPRRLHVCGLHDAGLVPWRRLPVRPMHSSRLRGRNVPFFGLRRAEVPRRSLRVCEPWQRASRRILPWRLVHARRKAVQGRWRDAAGHVTQ